MKMKRSIYYIAIMIILSVASCSSKKKQQETTPWGSTINESTDSVSSTKINTKGLSLDDILENGELIMLTINGPTTYYDYHNHGMGLQYLLCEKFAQQIGVSLRVEECKDTTEMINKLEKGEGDIIAVPLPKEKMKKNLLFCGVTPDNKKTQWVVACDNKSLADTLNRWFRPQMIAETQKEENYLLSTQSVRRHVYSPFLNRSKGIISKYDRYFQMYSGTAKMDWRLIAAQCYQESCFDPNAKSWAGACGLMQIMPSTADHLGLPMSMVHEPEANIAAAAKYMAELQQHFSDIGDPGQRILFALAAYNGGMHHIRDAMTLTRKNGGNPTNWGAVKEYVLKLSQPTYYNDPSVKYGYMRGAETTNYVDKIRSRWGEYCGGNVPMRTYSGSGNFGGEYHGAPTRAKRHYQKKYNI